MRIDLARLVRLPMAMAVLATALAISCGGESGHGFVTEIAETPTPESAGGSTPISSRPTAEPAGTAPFVVNVAVSDLEISPSTVAVPVGRPVLLVVRNRGLREHGYHIDGLFPKDMVWFELAPEGLESAPASGHTGASEHQATEPAQPDAETLAVLDEHAAHHDNWAMVPHRVCDTKAGGPCGHDGHIQARLLPGDTAFVMFIPASPGRHGVSDLTNPDLSATLVVF